MLQRLLRVEQMRDLSKINKKSQKEIQISEYVWGIILWQGSPSKGLDPYCVCHLQKEKNLNDVSC